MTSTQKLTSKQNRRYHLHRRLRQRGIRCDAVTSSIEVGVDDPTDSPYIQELIQEYNYQLQYIIQ